jgi:hypothetical protein
MLCLAGTSNSGAAREPEARPEAPRLNIHAPAGLEPAAARVAQMDREALISVMRLVGLAHSGAPITVVLAAEDSELGKATPDWIAGFAEGAAGTIVLFPSRSPRYPHDSLEDTLRHEVAHILIARAARHAFVPRWFHEGLALTAERASGLQDRARLMLAVAIERRPVSQLDAAFGAGQSEAARAYALSGALVRDILRRHGGDAAARILAGLGSGETFDQSFLRVTGETVFEVERAFWRDSWWYEVVPFLTSSVALWFAVVFLAMYARRARAVRRATLRRQWEDEEAQEPELHDDHEHDQEAQKTDEHGQHDEQEQSSTTNNRRPGMLSE